WAGALALARRGGAPAREEADMLMSATEVANYRHSPDARGLAEQALAIAERLQDPELECRALIKIAATLKREQRAEEGLTALARAEAIATTLPGRELEAWVHSQRAVILMDLGRTAAAVESLGMIASEEARRVGLMLVSAHAQALFSL